MTNCSKVCHEFDPRARDLKFLLKRALKLSIRSSLLQVDDMVLAFLLIPFYPSCKVLKPDSSIENSSRIYRGSLSQTQQRAKWRVVAKISETDKNVRGAVSRRAMLRYATLATLAAVNTPLAKVLAESTQVKEKSEATEAEYRGPLSLGFKFMYPKTWTPKKKPIKTHEYEINVNSPETSSTTAGVIVDPVKIDSIEDFGSPKDIGEKVVAKELRKDGVASADLIRYDTTNGKDGLTHYVVEYKVKSSRGEKHFLAKATVTGYHLYVLTAQAKEANFPEAEAALNRIVDTFEVKRQYT